MINIEVAYATPQKQKIIALQVEVGTDLLSAAKASGIDREFPEIDWNNAVMGVWSKLEKAPASREVKAGDRIEIYRPLKIDPKEARRNRAAKSANS